MTNSMFGARFKKTEVAHDRIRKSITPVGHESKTPVLSKMLSKAPKGCGSQKSINSMTVTNRSKRIKVTLPELPPFKEE